MGVAVLILVIDDHPLYRDALARLLPQIFAGAVVAQAKDCAAAFACLRQSPPYDLALLDLKMPGLHGHSALAHLRREFPALKVVIVSASEDQREAQRCITAGASGFIPKSARTEVLAAALCLIDDGGIYLPSSLSSLSPAAADEPSDMLPRAARRAVNTIDNTLTPRELEVLRLLCEGHSNKDIARRLGIAEPTVRAHLSAVFRALGVVNRTQAAREAGRRGLVRDQ